MKVAVLVVQRLFALSAREVLVDAADRCEALGVRAEHGESIEVPGRENLVLLHVFEQRAGFLFFRS